MIVFKYGDIQFHSEEFELLGEQQGPEMCKYTKFHALDSYLTFIAANADADVPKRKHGHPKKAINTNEPTPVQRLVGRPAREPLFKSAPYVSTVHAIALYTNNKDI